MATALRSGSALLAALLAAPACHPSCEQVCEKLLACEEVVSPRVSQAECEDACTREEALYEDWDDQALVDAWEDELSCIVDSSCAEVADGACYDEELFLF